jgi:cysteine desulfurase
MIYLDNAATTRLDAEVINEMGRVMNNYFGNPSSIHQQGRESRVIIEEGRKKIAGYIGVMPAEIVFTSGGTEALNIAISQAIQKYGIKNIISSRIEHPAVLNTLKYFTEKGLVNPIFVRLKEKGIIDIENLESLLKTNANALVCLMHANNETGNLLPIKETGQLCRQHNAMFLSDMVQTLCKYENNIPNFNLDFIACSAHKFHGPKGCGFLYINKNLEASPMVHGGGQERNIRSGTENIYGIAGMAKAFEVAHRDMQKNIGYISGLKAYMIEQLKNNFPEIEFNGDCENSGLYTILNVSFPETVKTKMLIQKLDIAGISVSGGSACHSAKEAMSYVLRETGTPINRTSVRFSFSKFNSKKDLDICIETLLNLLTGNK